MESESEREELSDDELAEALRHTAARWGVSVDELHIAGCCYAVNNPEEVLGGPT